MNAALTGALAQLAKSQPKGVPSKAVILGKPDKNKWSGKQANGDTWQLIKNSPTSYNVICN